MIGTMHKVTVYTKPRCVQCDHTKKRFDKRVIPYDTVDITEDDAAYAFITQGLGYQAAPVVCVGENGAVANWSGYRPDLIDSLLELS